MITGHHLESSAGMWNVLSAVSNESAPPVGGSCRDEDPELFFPFPGAIGQILEAKTVCAGCPVLADCRVYAMSQSDGIWGGLTEDERRELSVQARERKTSVAELLQELADSDALQQQIVALQQQLDAVTDTRPVEALESPRAITAKTAKQRAAEREIAAAVDAYIATTSDTDLFAKGA